MWLRLGLRTCSLTLALAIPSACDGGPASAETSAGTTSGTTDGTSVGQSDPDDDGATSMPMPSEDSTTHDGTTGSGPPADTTDGGEGSSSGGAPIDSVCGDGVAEGLEECDEADLDGRSCMTQGFQGGELACNRDCLFEIAGCFNAACGNEVLEGIEECDGSELSGESCVTQGFDGGALACAADCTYDSTGCVTFVCGNNLVEGDEACDGTAFGGATCGSLGFGGGTLACAADCSALVTSSCYAGNCCAPGGNGTPGCMDAACTTQICAADPFCCNDHWDNVCSHAAAASCAVCGVVCGDGAVVGEEDCDGANLGGQSCASLPGFVGGALSCTAGCTYNTNGCTPVPSWSANIQPVWNASCGCHTPGGTLPTFSGVGAGTSYANLVNVDSAQVALDFVEPGSSGSSYIIHKLNGTQAVGSQMPFGGAPLAPATINMISSWINDGAPNN